MNLKEDLELNVEEVLKTNTVAQAKRLMSARSGVWVVSAVSLIESALPLPLITDPFLVAAILVDKTNTTRLVIAATITSVVGGIIAYLMFFLFFETVLQWMTQSMIGQFHEMVGQVNNGYSSTFILTILGAVTPVPYTIVAWVVGAVKGSLWAFATASVIGRGGRYIIVGYSTKHFGPLAINYARRYIGIVSVVLVISIILYFWWKM